MWKIKCDASQNFFLGGGKNPGSTNGQLNYTKLDLLIIRIVIKSMATRCHILRLKCTQFDSGQAAPEIPLGELTVILHRGVVQKIHLWGHMPQVSQWHNASDRLLQVYPIFYNGGGLQRRIKELSKGELVWEQKSPGNRSVEIWEMKCDASYNFFGRGAKIGDELMNSLTTRNLVC